MAEETTVRKRGRPKKRGTAYKNMTIRVTIPEYNFVQSTRKKVQRTKPRGTIVTQRSLFLEGVQIIADTLERAEQTEKAQRDDQTSTGA